MADMTLVDIEAAATLLWRYCDRDSRPGDYRILRRQDERLAEVALVQATWCTYSGARLARAQLAQLHKNADTLRTALS